LNLAEYKSSAFGLGVHPRGRLDDPKVGDGFWPDRRGFDLLQLRAAIERRLCVHGGRGRKNGHGK
jgi:hypothetical protein